MRGVGVEWWGWTWVGVGVGFECMERRERDGARTFVFGHPSIDQQGPVARQTYHVLLGIDSYHREL